MKKLNRKNKSRLCYLLTIPFLTLTNIPNIIFSYDNDVFAMAVDSSRGNRVYFSKEEDDQLRRLVEANGIKNWSLIAEQMPGRDSEQCCYRWNHHLKYPTTRKGPFTPEEDEQLRRLLIEANGTKKWSLIAKQMGNERSPKIYRNRWTNYLSPDITKKGPFTQEEDELLIQKVQEFGTKWTIIAGYFTGRSPASLTNRYNLISHKGIISVKQKQVVQQNLQVTDNTTDNTDFGDSIFGSINFNNNDYFFYDYNEDDYFNHSEDDSFDQNQF